MERQSLTKTFVDQLNRLIDSKQIDSMDDVVFNGSMCKKLLYPTNDLLLHKHQFSALVNCLEPSENLYIFQVGDNGQWQDENLPLFRFSASDSEYSDYENLNFYQPTVMFSDSVSWGLVIDESLEGGIGILVGEADFIHRFEEKYQRSDQDLINFVSFHLTDAQKRNTGYQYLQNIIEKLK